MGDSQQTNRQIALARIASSAIDGSSSLAYSSQSSTSTNASKPTNQQGTKRKGLSLDYCEFNLSTMVDTRGGFLLPEYSLEENPAAATGLELRNQPPVQIPSNAVCRECESIDLCSDLFRHYSMQVCRRCKEEFKDKYSLLTKTEAREDYLLTDSELRDQEKLPHWMKKNPHKDSYANMLLYLRMHVEQFAIEKWGSLEKLDEEFARRQEEKTVRKKKKFETKLVELRKKTLTSTWKRPEKEHVHEFGEKVAMDDGFTFEQTCITCGIVTSFEEL